MTTLLYADARPPSPAWALRDPASAPRAEAPRHPDLRLHESANVAADPWFAGLSPALREALLARARVRHVTRGTVLVRRGDLATDWVGVASGALRLSQAWHDGHVFTLQLLSPGEWFGDIELLDQSPAALEVQAHMPSTLLLLPRHDLRDLVRDSDELREAFLQLNCRRLRWMLRRIEELQALPLWQRVAVQLQRLGRQFGRPALQGLRIEVPLAQSDLADLLCASRQRINTVLRRMQALGIVVGSHARITLTDLDRLEDVAQGRLRLDQEARD